MPSSDLVSILVPAYNHAPYVAQCLDALARQTHPRCELLIVDDGSSDGTAEEVERALGRHPDRFERVVWHPHTENAGAATRLNEMLERARGRFVFLNASDDRAEPHAISRLVAALDEDSRVALAVGDSMIIDARGDRVYWASDRQIVREEKDARYLTWVEYLRDTSGAQNFAPRRFGRVGTLWVSNYIPNGKLMRRDAIVKAGGWRSGGFEDWDLNFRLALRYRFAFVDEVIYAYRWHDTNTVKDLARTQVLGTRTREALRAELRDPRVWLRVAVRQDPRRKLGWWARRAGVTRTEDPGSRG